MVVALYPSTRSDSSVVSCEPRVRAETSDGDRMGKKNEVGCDIHRTRIIGLL